MVPWIECPSLDLDLSVPLAERFRSIPEELLDRPREQSARLFVPRDLIEPAVAVPDP